MTCNWIEFDSIEDIDIKGEEILLWDGCDHHIDYVDVCADTGTFYFANGSSATHWAILTSPIIDRSNERKGV